MYFSIYNAKQNFGIWLKSSMCPLHFILYQLIIMHSWREIFSLSSLVSCLSRFYTHVTTSEIVRDLLAPPFASQMSLLITHAASLRNSSISIKGPRKIARDRQLGLLFFLVLFFLYSYPFIFISSSRCSRSDGTIKAFVRGADSSRSFSKLECNFRWWSKF